MPVSGRMFMRTAVCCMFVTAATAAAQQPTSLKEAYEGDFYVGAALDAAEITGQDQLSDSIVLRQFNSISPENALKWEIVNPEPGQYDFGLADQYVAFGVKHHLWIVGHNLVWHNQVPAWVFRDKDGKLLTRDALLKRMKGHILREVGRYKGKIQSWDVVNEALNDDGTLRQSLWYKIIGPDYIAKAFEYAHEADPQAQLTYNDYNLASPAKLAGVIRLVKQLKAEGITIDCVGMQSHEQLESPTPEQVDAAIRTIAATGVQVAISEMDVNVLPNPLKQNTASVSIHMAANPKLNPWPNGLPAAMQQKLAGRYAALFQVFYRDRADISRVTLWGVTNAQSWKNNWPIPGRTNYPLLFNRAGEPTPAYYAVLRIPNEAAK
ncbi:MAG TPA: endo-1,4-beta-xylanase [Acidobacteriaceae bacterium]|nr:endo-1,4-beta-xylanase [Acidobacteriaceae bacterium]